MGGYSSFKLFALGGYVFAAIFLCAGFYLRSKTRRLIDSGLVAKGTIVAIESATSMSSDAVDRVFHPVFEFRDMQGIEHRVRSAAGSAPASHKVGDIVEVLYHAHSPHEAIIDSRDYVQMVWVCFFAGSAAVVIATLIVILEWK